MAQDGQSHSRHAEVNDWDWSTMRLFEKLNQPWKNTSPMTNGGKKNAEHKETDGKQKI